MSLRGQHAVRSLLAGDAGIRAQVVDRVYPLRAPQGAARPYIVYGRSEGGHEHHLMGASGLAIGGVEVTAYCDDYDQAAALGESMRDALDGFRGRVAIGNDVVNIRMLNLINDDDGMDPPQDSSDEPIYWVSHDYRVAELETAPTHP